jgi:hypothetical protein
MRRGEGRRTGGTACKVCNHPGRGEIEAMLLNGAEHKPIIAKMQAAHPGAPVLNGPNLTRHYKNHLITKPIMVKTTDGETGAEIEGYVAGHLSRSLTISRDAIPKKEDRISVPEALAIIINAGARNVVMNPDTVTPKDMLAAMEMARKLGLGGQADDEFADAWKALNRNKKRKTTLTVETTEELPAEEPPTIIDVTGQTGDWPAEDLKLLEAPSGEEES